MLISKLRLYQIRNRNIGRIKRRANRRVVSMANYLQETTLEGRSSSFDELAVYFSATDKTGSPFDDMLTKLVAELLTDKLPTTKIEELTGNYVRPENFEQLMPPNVNKVVLGNCPLFPFLSFSFPRYFF